ncbi:calcium-binding protein [Leptolyngbya ohadii]|uniref:calcium-binding protein n=1 Tax=Leptolyngbya ohadii TaxID=1962290 RepID=UPI00117A2057|nr:calcium-binding protein [Leptolyngbya ohadii]
MSEVITAAPGGSFPVFGLEVISQGPVTLRSGPNAPAGTIQVIGSSANDVIQPLDLNAATPLLISGAEGSDELRGSAGIDEISGGNNDDLVLGNAGDDSLQGDAGADQIFGGLGNDLIFGGIDADRLFGNEGSDEILGEGGNDRISGGTENDILSGGRGTDRLSGDAGDDDLIAGQGADILVGGDGRDTFIFGRTSRAGLDRVRDFSSGEDKILLDQALLPGSGLGRGRLRAGDFAAIDDLPDESSEDIAAKIIYVRSTGTVFYNPADGTPVALLRLSKDLPITAADFEIGTGL